MENGAEEGSYIPGLVLLASKYMQEIAPDVAMDRAEIISMDETADAPAGTNEDVLQAKEITLLEPVEFKWHTLGIGIIQDAELMLEEYGFVD